MTYAVTAWRKQFLFAAVIFFILSFAQACAMALPVSHDGNVVGTWYYTAIIKADGTEQQLGNADYLWLKDDGAYEDRFGARYGQIGTFAVNGNRLTLNREGGDKKVYTIEFADGGKTMSLKSGAGGYKLKRE